MPAPIDGDSLEPKIDRREMGAGGDAALAQDRSGEQPTEPGRVLEHGDLVPGIERYDRLQDRRQVLGRALVPRATPPAVRPHPSQDRRQRDPFPERFWRDLVS